MRDLLPVILFRLIFFTLKHRFSARHMSGTHLLKTERSFCSSTPPQIENQDPHVLPIPAVTGQELFHPKRSIRKMTSFRDLKVGSSSSRRAPTPPEGHFGQAISTTGSNCASSTRATSKPFATLSNVMHWIRDPKKNNPKKGIPEEFNTSLTPGHLSRTPSRIRSDTLPSRRSPDMGARSKNERRPKHIRRQSQIDDIESHVTGFKPSHHSKLSYEKMFRERISPSKNHKPEDTLEISCQFQSYKQDSDNRSSFETLEQNADFDYGDDTIQLPKWPDRFDS